jgi:vitamin B12/bleomycin/antimicrobial peptide transport system ATP-binding/permease protein
LYAVAMSVVLRLFWNALSAKDAVRFARLMKAYAVAVVAGPVVLTAFDWAKGRLALLWRGALTERFLGAYFEDGGGAMPYYRIAMGDGAIDNSDQRLSEDIRAFTDRAVRFLCVFGVAVFDLAIFSIILYKIYPPLFVALIAYSLVGTVGVSLYGRNLVGVNARQLELEAVRAAS